MVWLLPCELSKTHQAWSVYEWKLKLLNLLPMKMITEWRYWLLKKIRISFGIWKYQKSYTDGARVFWILMDQLCVKLISGDCVWRFYRFLITFLKSLSLSTELASLKEVFLNQQDCHDISIKFVPHILLRKEAWSSLNCQTHNAAPYLPLFTQSWQMVLLLPCELSKTHQVWSVYE